MRETIDAGINLLDVAPRYGDAEAERVVGDALGGRLPESVRVSTKHRVSIPPPADVLDRLERSLKQSLERVRPQHVDLFFLHGYLVGSEHDGGERRTPLQLFEDAVRPAFQRLVDQGRIGAWGITAVGVPDAVLEALGREPRAGAIQAKAKRVGVHRRAAAPRQPQR